jgi:hypothetical protein
MLTEKSITLPSAVHLTGSLAARGIEIFVVSTAAAISVTAIQGGYCELSPHFDLAKKVLCTSDLAGDREEYSLFAIGIYFLWLFFMPLHKSHDAILVFSHHTSWVHAVANWLSRLKGIVNPQTDFQELINASSKVIHAYQRNNLVAFAGVVSVTLLLCPFLLAPWEFAARTMPGIRHLQWVSAALVVAYLPILYSFVTLGWRIVSERGHSEPEDD